MCPPACRSCARNWRRWHVRLLPEAVAVAAVCAEGKVEEEFGVATLNVEWVGFWTVSRPVAICGKWALPIRCKFVILGRRRYKLCWYKQTADGGLLFPRRSASNRGCPRSADSGGWPDRPDPGGTGSQAPALGLDRREQNSHYGFPYGYSPVNCDRKRRAGRRNRRKMVE